MTSPSCAVAVLLNLAFVTEAELTSALSGQLGFRYVAAGLVVVPACSRPSALALAIERHYRGVVFHHR